MPTTQPSAYSQIINLTPHDCHYVKPDGSIITIPRSGIVARLETVQSSPRDVLVDGCAMSIVPRRLGRIQDLPGESRGTLYLVSAMVLDAAPRRQDLIAPGDLVRDAEGRIIGCSSWHASGPVMR